MHKLKVGDGPFVGSNVEIIRKFFGKSVEPNIHGSYEIKKNKWMSFIYLAIQRPNGSWILPSKAPSNYWFNKPNSDNTEFIRECYEENLKKRFASPDDEYAIFNKTSTNESSFYGVFKLKEVRRDYIECVFERINTELDLKVWK